MSGVVWGIDPVFLENQPELSGLNRKVFVSRGQAFRAFWEGVRSSPSLAAVLAKTLLKGAVFSRKVDSSFPPSEWEFAEDLVRDMIERRFASMHPRLRALWENESQGAAVEKLFGMALLTLRESRSLLDVFERLFRLCLWEVGEEEASRLYVILSRFWESGSVTWVPRQASQGSWLDEQGIWHIHKGQAGVPFLHWGVGQWWRREVGAWETLSPVLLRALPRTIRLFGFFFEDMRFTTWPSPGGSPLIYKRLWEVSPFALWLGVVEHQAKNEPLSFLRDFLPELEDAVLVRYEVDTSVPSAERELRRVAEEGLWGG